MLVLLALALLLGCSTDPGITDPVTLEPNPNPAVLGHCGQSGVTQWKLSA